MSLMDGDTTYVWIGLRDRLAGYGELRLSETEALVRAEAQERLEAERRGPVLEVPAD